MANKKISELASLTTAVGTEELVVNSSGTSKKITVSDLHTNMVITGTVDGRDLAADGSKLDGIEAGATADQNQSDINALGITAVSVDLGNWTITESGGVAYFATLGVNKMKLDASGNLTVVGDITAFGTI